MKAEKRQILITTIATLFPILIGLMLWSRLPDEIPSHWNLSGEIDGYSSRAFGVFFIPLFAVVMHLVCIFATMHDPKNENVTSKLNRMILWICPVVSISTSVLMYAAALGYGVDSNLFISLLSGILLVIFGNYLPKCRPNYTIGIRIPWTLNDEENWTKTHRMAGPIWMAGGLVLILDSVIRWHWEFVLFAVLLLLVALPVGYSFRLYLQKQ